VVEEEVDIVRRSFSRSGENMRKRTFFGAAVIGVVLALYGSLAVTVVTHNTAEPAADATPPMDLTALAGSLASMLPKPVLAASAPVGADGVGLVDTDQGIWHLRTRNGDPASFFFGNPGDYPIMGDWDCDGVDTPGLYRRSDGYVYLRNANTQGPANIRFFFGNPGDFPLAGDFNADGCDTVSIYRPSEAKIYVINALGANDGGLGAADYGYVFGNPGDKPFTGDFNSNGTDTVGLHRESTGFMYFRNTNSQGNAHNEFYFGDPGDRLVSGNWLGTGEDYPAVYRPSNRTVYMRHSNTQGNADEQYQWGESHYVPVAGRFGTLNTGVTVNVSGAPTELAYAVESFYNDQQAAPHIPAELRSTLLGLFDFPKTKTITGTAKTSEAYGKGVAVVESNGDTLLAVTNNGWEWRVVGANPSGLGRTLAYGPGPRFVSIIGADWQKSGSTWPTTPLKTNADSVHIYTVDPVAGAGSIVGFPRSTYIDSPQGHIRVTKTMEGKSPENTVEALKLETGLPIEGYLHTGMGSAYGGGSPPPGFQDLVDAMGGFPFLMPYNAGPAVAGDNHVNGAEALALARERITLPHGGPDRSLAQGLLMKSALATIKPLGMLEIPNLLSIMDGFVNTNLSVDDLLTLAATVYTVNPGPMPTLTPADLVNSSHVSGTGIVSSHPPYNQNEGTLPNVIMKGCLFTPDNVTFGYDLQPIQDLTFLDLQDGVLTIHPWICDDGS
jgi:hypothetical protein